MRINYNVQAMRANLSLNKADDKVSASIARLSSGMKIAVAKDNPSGYAISKRMNLQIEGLSQAIQSSNDANSVISIADGALQEVSDMISRMSELAVQAANGTINDEDRQLCQDEINQLKDEINRVAKTTQFNGQTLMDGSFDLKGYTDNLQFRVATYSDATPVDVYNLQGLKLEFDSVEDEFGVKTYFIDADKTIAANDAAGLTGKNLGAQFPDGARVSAVDGRLVTITAPNDFSITLDISDAYIQAQAGTASDIGAVKIDITGIGAMDMQIGTNEDQIISIRIPELSLQLMSIDDLDVSTIEGASKGMDDLKTALEYVNSLRSRLGAYQNRLDHTISSLGVTNEAMTSAYSGLVDADMAEETVTYTTEQVISQAATSVLAQANDRPSQALQLLQ